MTCIYLFTRDLRIEDNYALDYACTHYKHIIPMFCYDPVQTDEKNSYRSCNAICFMIASVNELDESLGGKLNIFKCSTLKAIQSIKQYDQMDIIVSKDYTPFSNKRTNLLQSLGNTVIEVENHKICSKDVLTGSHTTYTVFSPYYRKAAQLPVPNLLEPKKFKLKLIYLKQKDSLPHTCNEHVIEGGRSNALQILKKLECCTSYGNSRDIPKVYTSRLSAHHKFGTVSIRETYWAIQKNLKGKHKEMMTRQLYWRDFYYNIADRFPHVFKGSYQRKYNALKWENNRTYFKCWESGRTGFPIVDAGMRQLVKEGWMHNRLRMIVSSFLTKDLLISWKKGERFFAQHLVDYDPCQNNGGWQWAAGTGTDAQPYFRIFNPWSQSKKFDPDGDYIKKYVPELKDVNPKDLHSPIKLQKAIQALEIKYSSPIVDHALQRHKALEMYKSI